MNTVTHTQYFSVVINRPSKVIPLVSDVNINIQIKLTIMLAMQETTGFSSPKERLSGFSIVQVTWKPGSFSLAICRLHLQYFHGFTCSHIIITKSDNNSSFTGEKTGLVCNF